MDGPSRGGPVVGVEPGGGAAAPARDEAIGMRMPDLFASSLDEVRTGAVCILGAEDLDQVTLGADSAAAIAPPTDRDGSLGADRPLRPERSRR